MNTWMKLTACLLAIVLLAVAPVAYAAESQEDKTEKLQALLDVANNVKEEKYTSDSWAVLEETVALANAALASGDEQLIADAVSQLASALAKLTSLKYDAMEDAIAQAEQYMKENDHAFTRLKQALDQAEDSYGCGNQAQVDRATKAILECLEDYRNGIIDEKTETSSKMWIFLAIAGVCVVALVCIVGYMLMNQKRRSRRRRHIDDVPLVEYDIDDDLI